MQRTRRSPARTVALGLCLLALSAHGGAAQTVEQFYKGKTINFLVASVPGGVNDLTARLISRHLGRHLPGNPNIIVQNLQSSGLALTNRIYNTPGADGLTIGIVERGVPQVAIMGDVNARFDPLKITWLGSVSSYANDAYTLSVNATFYAKTVEDLRKPDRPSAKIGSTGAGATNGIFTNIAKDVLGLNIQHVRGYRGAADVFLAQQRNELDGQVVGLASIKVGTAGLVAGGRVPAADHVRAHDALRRVSRCADRARTDQGPEGAAAARFRGSAVLHGAAAGGAARIAGGARRGAAGGLHGDDQGPGVHRGGAEDEPRALTDRRRGGAQGDRADASDAAGGDRAVQGDRGREELQTIALLRSAISSPRARFIDSPPHPLARSRPPRRGSDRVRAPPTHDPGSGFGVQNPKTTSKPASPNHVIA